MKIVSRSTQALGIVGAGLIALNAIIWLTSPVTGFGVPQGGGWWDFRFTYGELIGGAIGIIFLTIAWDVRRPDMRDDHGHLRPVRSHPSRPRRPRPTKKKRL